MKGIVLVTTSGKSFAAVPAGTGGDFTGTCHAHFAMLSGAAGSFGPAFDTEAKALALARSAAVALAEGTGGVFGEPLPTYPLKTGDRVMYVVEGSASGDGGTVTRVSSDGFDVKWSDDGDEGEYEWADVGLYVAKAPAGPA